MKECPTCRLCFADDVAFCPDDGASTSPSIAGDPILDGRYNLERRLGQGGMGIVYKGRHIFLKTQHAIKIILPDLVGNDPNLVTRFRQEALAAAAIRHQNIIAVTDFGVVRGTMPFLVMEFVQGKSLQELMSEEGAMGPVRAFEIMRPICLGIAAAHRQNIVHRDLKPLNVMIQSGLSTAEGVKILDFGLAKIKSGELLGSFVAAQTTGLMGSPFYMAPEQWSDEPPDARADVYSLGVMLYQMLCGEVPFKAATIPAIMKKHLTEEPPSLASRGADVPPQIEAVIHHALQKEPQDRTPSADEFLAEFQKAMAEASALLRTTGEARQPDPYKTIITAAPDTQPQVGRASHSRPTEELVAAALSNQSWIDEQEKLAAAREELAREEAARRLTAEAERKRKLEEAQQEAERQQQLKLKQEEEQREAERLEAEKRAAEEREAEKRAAEAREAENKRAAEEKEREAQRVRDEAAARKLREEEEARRKEEERKLREAEAAQRKEEQRLEEERRREEERTRVEELVTQQTKAIEERLTKLASSIPPAPGAVADLEVTPARPVGATTVTENSYPTLISQQAAAAAPRKPTVVPYVLAAVLALALVGGGIGAWVMWPKPTPTPAGGDNPPIENPSDPGPNPVTFSPEFISIPGGTFDMGREGATVSEVPVHATTVKPFVIDKTEVTNYEYQQFVEKTGYEAPSHWSKNKPIAGQELLPVTFVSHDDALAFAKWRSERDGVKWRLPTEEEWEYAARGGDQENIYPWGNTWTEGNAVTKTAGASAPATVGSTTNDKTRWGVMDMQGNVYEWTSTKAIYYPGSTRRVEGEQRNWYVIRGASFGTSQDPKPISATRRDWVDGNTKVGVLGFRLVRSQ